jgi:hypothetical protein
MGQGAFYESAVFRSCVVTLLHCTQTRSVLTQQENILISLEYWLADCKQTHIPCDNSKTNILQLLIPISWAWDVMLCNLVNRFLGNITCQKIIILIFTAMRTPNCTWSEISDKEPNDSSQINVSCRGLFHSLTLKQSLYSEKYHLQKQS